MVHPKLESTQSLSVKTPMNKQEKSSGSSQVNLPLINPNAAGIDLGADRHWVSVPVGRDSESVRSFACFTAELYAMADWLKQCRIETVAMESTGVYWIPVFQVLESRGFDVKLVNAHYVKTVPGRKTDILDCQWLQKLHSHGLLSGSFRPDDQICVLRSYIRQRDNLIKSACVHVQRMQKALIEMNLQLHRVISDITGTTGLSIIKAIIAGERNPLSKDYPITVLGDREFCSVELGQWLENQGLAICLRLKRNEYIRRQTEFTQQLKQLGLKPGMSMFFAGVNVTKQLGFSQFNVACKWKRKYRSHQTDEGWFLLTNLPTVGAATTAYQQRSGIECMFRDCKSGGYNLEGCYVNEPRLSAIVLLIAIAYTSAIIQGIDISSSNVECYICRPKEHGRIQRRHSNFWIGLYSQSWLYNFQLCIDWVGKWMRLNRNKRLYYQQGLRAIDLIQPAF
jgi:hypothetical protein